MKIAVLMTNISRYTGGRVSMWQFAFGLTHLGHDVTVYTDQRSGYIVNDWRGKKKPKVKVGLAHDVKADLYLGMPIAENEMAVDLAAKHGGRALCFIFDTYPQLKRAGIEWRELPKVWPKLNQENVWPVASCETNVPYICEWCGVEPDQVKVLAPCVNDQALDLGAKIRKRNEITFLSRLVEHKNLVHLLDATEPLGVGVTIITSDRVDREDDRISWRIRVSDKIKFRILRASRAVCVPSTYEGFGMWAIEAWAAGIPVVCYDLPPIRANAVNGGAYFAKVGDKWDLQRQLVKCFDENPQLDPDKRFYFGQMAQRLEALIEEIIPGGTENGDENIQPQTGQPRSEAAKSGTT